MPDKKAQAPRPKRNYHIPAESIRNCFLESSLGLHLLTSGFIFEGILVASAFVAAVGLLAYTLTHTDYEEDPYCCYPSDIQSGHLGRCDDPKADIHTTFGVQECATRSIPWIRLLYISVYLFILDWILIFLFDIPFQYYVKREVSLAHVYGRIPKIQWWVALYGPSALLFGAHNFMLQRKAIKWLHLGCGILSICLVFFFVYIALKLDDAWGCYGNVGASSTNEGMCNDQTSAIAQRGKRDSTVHAPVYWWALGLMASFLFLATVFYVVSITSIRDTVWSRASRYALKQGVQDFHSL
jgi:hypothetical protein